MSSVTHVFWLSGTCYREIVWTSEYGCPTATPLYLSAAPTIPYFPQTAGGRLHLKYLHCELTAYRNLCHIRQYRRWPLKAYGHMLFQNRPCPRPSKCAWRITAKLSQECMVTVNRLQTIANAIQCFDCLQIGIPNWTLGHLGLHCWPSDSGGVLSVFSSYSWASCYH